MCFKLRASSLEKVQVMPQTACLQLEAYGLQLIQKRPNQPPALFFRQIYALPVGLRMAAGGQP
jgi:hypothetical protein